MKKTIILANILLFGALFYFLQKDEIKEERIRDATPFSYSDSADTTGASGTSEAESNRAQSQSVTSTEKSSEKILITDENYAKELHACFGHHNCTINDPLKFYKKLKVTNPEDVQDYIVLLRRFTLEDPAFRDRHRETIAGMIKDHFAPDIVNLQLADFYYFSRDFDKSLTYYQKVDSLHKKDPRAPAVPHLNYANLLFDMKKYKEALPFYQQALKNLDEHADSPDSLEVLDFINERIDEIKSK